MTHKDIYTKFMIEYDKANVTSSYPSLTEYEVATVLDKAYNALIAQKVTGNNIRRVGFEGDSKAIVDIAPLITRNNLSITNVSNVNILKCEVPKDMLYYVSSSLSMQCAASSDDIMDEITIRPIPIKLVTHEIADKFIISPSNLPWIKTPVCYIENNILYVVYDPIKIPNMGSSDKLTLVYIKKPCTFVKDFVGLSGESLISYIKNWFTSVGFSHTGIDTYGTDIITGQKGLSEFSFFKKPTLGVETDPENDGAYNTAINEINGFFYHAYNFECSDTVAEELISLAVTFALENVESQRLNSKLNMRGLEA